MPPIKGLAREHRRYRRQHAMRVDGAAVRRVQLDLLYARQKLPLKTGQK